jgi:hypothetical protein
MAKKDRFLTSKINGAIPLPPSVLTSASALLLSSLAAAAATRRWRLIGRAGQYGGSESGSTADFSAALSAVSAAVRSSAETVSPPAVSPPPFRFEFESMKERPRAVSRAAQAASVSSSALRSAADSDGSRRAFSLRRVWNVCVFYA